MSQAPGDHRVFPPPDVPVECFCLHCGHVYTTDLMIPIDIEGELHYCCPAEGCTAMGWEFDIFPVSDEDSVNGQWIEDDEFEDDDSDGNADFEVHGEPGEPTPFDDPPDFETESESANTDLMPSESFDPPKDWTPESDREDDEEFDFDDDQYDASQRFTQEDYDRLKQSGEIDRRIAEIRQHWIDGAKDRETTANPLDDWDDKPFKDEDIPF